jgi:hypothetical protein
MGISVRGISIAMVLAVFGVVAPPALAQPTLGGAGEHLTGTPTAGCTSTSDITYQVSGQATGPYPGTFTESGRFQGFANFHATFTINSGSTTITGTKTGFAIGDSATCNSVTHQARLRLHPTYTARWSTTTGNALLATRATYTDSGTSELTLDTFVSPSTFDETFTSGQAQATLVKCELVLLGTVAIPIATSACA